MIPRHLQIALAVLLAAALGLSIYAWHVRKTVAATPVAPVDTRPLAPPVTGPTEKVVLYVAQDDDGTLRAQPAQIPMPSGRQQRAEELARALISLYLDKNSPHVIGAGTEVRSVFLVDPGGVVIDMNGAFADSHRSGVLVEELTVASLIHTITANTPNILRVKILIDGKERETLAGHADLSSFYEVAAVDQLASQLQAGP
ncbi:MAG TPA: GerMN domain-containing protein [Candidatus Sulfotelmatobacter sp.]